jgi:hypothetical protein
MVDLSVFSNKFPFVSISVINKPSFYLFFHVVLQVFMSNPIPYSSSARL